MQKLVCSWLNQIIRIQTHWLIDWLHEKRLLKKWIKYIDVCVLESNFFDCAGHKILYILELHHEIPSDPYKTAKTMDFEAISPNQAPCILFTLTVEWLIWAWNSFGIRQLPRMRNFLSHLETFSLNKAPCLFFIIDVDWLKQRGYKPEIWTMIQIMVIWTHWFITWSNDWNMRIKTNCQAIVSNQVHMS